MVNYSDLAFIGHVLGDKAESVEIQVNGNKWQGLAVINIPDSGVSFSQGLRLEALRSVYANLIQKNWRSFSERNIRLWSDLDVNIYGIPEISVFDVLSYAEVGVGTSLGIENHLIVMESLHSVYALSPFEVLSASTCTLEVKFIEKIDFDQARDMQDVLVNIAHEVVRAACFEVYGTEDIETGRMETVVADSIIEQNGFYLCWE